MFNVLPALSAFFWEIIVQTFDLYTTCSVLAGFFALWVIDRMFGIFDVLKR